jgi:hypothetical protein
MQATKMRLMTAKEKGSTATANFVIKKPTYLKPRSTCVYKKWCGIIFLLMQLKDDHIFYFIWMWFHSK